MKHLAACLTLGLFSLWGIGSLTPASRAAGPNIPVAPAGHNQPTSAPLAVAAKPTPPLSEKAKIEALIQRVEKSGLIFIRNGQEYPAAKGADHLRRKWNWAGDRIKTARQFIEYIGAGSSQSGKPYLVKFPDGKTVPARDWLTTALNELEGKTPARANWVTSSTLAASPTPAAKAGDSTVTGPQRGATPRSGR